jgi:carbonic anhydrase/acetyltransferase-like protein (isoleucine patch superfamily)
VLGSGILLDSAMAAWRAVEPALELCPVALDPQGGPAALAALDALDLAGATAFVALDARFLNFRRLEIVDALRARGVAMPPLLESDGAAPGDNSWIGQGAIVQHGARIGANVHIGAGAIIGAGAVIGDSAWIDDGVVIGREAQIGAHATLGLGVIVAHGVGIGAMCVIDKPGRIEADIAARTFIHASHDRPMVVTGS